MPNRVTQLEQDALLSISEFVDPGRYSGLHLYFYGTNASATTATVDDLGDIQVKRDGETHHERSIEHYVDLNNIREGQNYFDSVSGGNFEATAFIPFYEKSFDQAYQITGKKELQFTYNPNTGVPGNFANLTLEVLGVQSFRDEEYDYFVLGQDVTPASAVSSRGYQLNEENITNVYLRDPSSILDSAGLRQDGEEKFSEQEKNILLSATLLENRLEVNNFDTIELQTMTIGKGGSIFNSSTVLKITTSASGTIPVSVHSIRLPQEA